ncbi:TAP-like protein-domain-containing protein [Astrocystis sublimbata]|nr:TAP-like protein-domain-containing protein [Astrocystis sublimbata]
MVSSLQLRSLAQAASLVWAVTAQGKNIHQARDEAERAYPKAGITWQPCPAAINDMATLPIECGTLNVTLDYTAANSTDKLELSLVRVPATKKPAEHSILFNFGGPGLEVRYTLALLADMLMAVTGGEHDLIGWDPRGTADTLTFSCTPDPSVRAALSSQLIPGNFSDTARGRNWAAAQNTADACADYAEARERAPLIGTPFTARDAMQIVDAVETDGLLRYWGFSYGTDLGATLAAMFPGRVERLLIDGVFSPIQYYYGMTDSESSASADDTFSEFFRQCVSTPEACTLARNRPNTTARQLESATYDLIDELKYRPFASNGSVIGYTELKAAIRFALYTPRTWLTLDNILDILLSEPRNETSAGTAIVEYLGGSLAAETQGDDAAIGIECVDKTFRTDSFDEISDALDEAQSVSRLLGDALAPLSSICARWKLEPREKFTARFEDVKPRKPLLVIGNTYDSATSIKSARNISQTIQGSVFLEHGGVGHASIQQPSLCTARAIQDFFRNGTLPAPNTVCSPINKPFEFAVSGPTWQDLFPQLGFEPPSLNGTKVSRAIRRGHTEEALQFIGRRTSRIF